MTKQEYLNSFDTLYNNIRSNSAPGLDLNEIEDITDKALRSLVINIYNNSFENSEEFRRDIATLLKTSTITWTYGYYSNGAFYSTIAPRPQTLITGVDGNLYIDTVPLDTYKCSVVNNVTTYTKLNTTKVNSNSLQFPLASDLLYITYETAKLKADSSYLSEKELLVVPVTQDELYKINKNPFKGPGANRVLRLDTGTNSIELISKYNLQSYLVRYLSVPARITFTSYTDTSDLCNFSDSFQQKLLETAVQLSKELWK